MKYIAHSENSNGVSQTMQEHSTGVGKFMRDFALSESFADLYEFCGLIHDIGKYSDEFQKYILGEGQEKVRHSIYGALYAWEKGFVEIALPVFGHHSGLPNCQEMALKIKIEQLEGSMYDSIFEVWQSDINQKMKIPERNALFNPDPSNILPCELITRLIFSSLVDADSLDTERHFYANRFNSRHYSSFDTEAMLSMLKVRLDALEKNTRRATPINILRRNVRLYAESKANMAQGFFSLSLPTGLGKTLCSINWALHHASHHKNIRRIIIVLPFISIIDQTAKELKEIFKDGDYVLEHHSNVIYEEDDKDETFDVKQLATENWDYPIIVTTSVQFFESLFGNGRSQCRKLHNIQDSIIIFDEIQTLPLAITGPTIIMLNNLQKLCRCSLLFCTATQPDFETRRGFEGIEHIEPLVENPEQVFKQTRRVTYCPMNNYEEITISELSDSVVSKQESALVVFNTKKKARMFYDAIKNVAEYKVFHLSTNMCPVHRKAVIEEIRGALKQKMRIIVSSTQLIEAGVDMDFPAVYRELAPLASIIQSAGRCNREGNMDNGNVYLFALSETGQPSAQYSSWTLFAYLHYRGKEDKLYTHDFYGEYYRNLIEYEGGTDKWGIISDMRKWAFQTVAEKYKVIDNNAQSVFVYTCDEVSRKLYDEIKNAEYLKRQKAQQISQYSVQVYLSKEEIECDKRFRKEPSGILVWFGDYSQEYGMPMNDELRLLMY